MQKTGAVVPGTGMTTALRSAAQWMFLYFSAVFWFSDKQDPRAPSFQYHPLFLCFCCVEDDSQHVLSKTNLPPDKWILNEHRYVDQQRIPFDKIAWTLFNFPSCFNCVPSCCTVGVTSCHCSVSCQFHLSPACDNPIIPFRALILIAH